MGKQRKKKIIFDMFSRRKLHNTLSFWFFSFLFFLSIPFSSPRRGSLFLLLSQKLGLSPSSLLYPYHIVLRFFLQSPALSPSLLLRVMEEYNNIGGNAALLKVLLFLFPVLSLPFSHPNFSRILWDWRKKKQIYMRPNKSMKSTRLPSPALFSKPFPLLSPPLLLRSLLLPLFLLLFLVGYLLFFLLPLLVLLVFLLIFLLGILMLDIRFFSFYLLTFFLACFLFYNHVFSSLFLYFFSTVHTRVYYQDQPLSLSSLQALTPFFSFSLFLYFNSS